MRGSFALHPPLRRLPHEQPTPRRRCLVGREVRPLDRAERVPKPARESFQRATSAHRARIGNCEAHDIASASSNSLGGSPTNARLYFSGFHSAPSSNAQSCVRSSGRAPQHETPKRPPSCRVLFVTDRRAGLFQEALRATVGTRRPQFGSPGTPTRPHPPEASPNLSRHGSGSMSAPSQPRRRSSIRPRADTRHGHRRVRVQVRRPPTPCARARRRRPHRS